MENPDEGIDTIKSFGGYWLGSNVENLILTDNINPSHGRGNALDNTIIGSAAHNVIDGAAGADLMIGGAGNDFYFVDQSGDVVVENPGEGTDTVRSDFDYSLGANFENLELSLGSDAVSGTGNELDNVILGNGQSNILIGLVGDDVILGNYNIDGTTEFDADIMVGGAGNDRYSVDDSRDVVVENSNEGIDTVESLISYTLGADVENLVLFGYAEINGTGNALNNVITGNIRANVLSGLDGHDTFIAFISDGNDTYSGGGGWDVLDCSQVGGVVQINQLNGITTGSAGNDVLLDVFEQIIGSDYGDVLSGGHGINCIDGGGGNDAIYGNGGDDLLRGGDGDDTIYANMLNDGNDRLLGGDGWDVLDYSNLAGVVQVDQLNGVTTGSANNDVLLDTFEQIIGSAYGDVLSGGHGINSLNGGGGNDQIFANGGDDWVRGGAGSDTITLGSGNDTFSFWQGDGADTITDFTAGAGSDDVISLTFKPTVANFAQVLNHSAQVGANTVINFGDGDVITLLNVTAANLHQDDFIFA